MAEILLKDETYNIIGAAIEVHKTLGPGFLEQVYQEAFEVEMTACKIPFLPQKQLSIWYKTSLLQKTYLADLVCYDKIIVELKSMEILTDREEAQILNYLKATGFQLGILINFGSHGKLEWKRYINTHDKIKASYPS
jgi:GxxExxY protein